MFTISKEFMFEASHQLDGMRKNHPCGRVHGHSYVVIVELKSEKLTDEGFVTDYGNLFPIKEYIAKHMDHRHLNDIMMFNPTAENLAKHLYDVFRQTFPKMSAVSVKETTKTLARYEP